MATPHVATAPVGDAGAYQARRSTKAARTDVKADGAVWRERLTVCEGVTEDGDAKLTIRSYYRNQVTQERVWDEPPSGASEIIFASTEQRKKADLQKQEMQLTLDELPPDTAKSAPAERGTSASPAATTTASSTRATENRKKGIFGRFSKKKERPFLADDSKDLNLQRAIALSVAEANGKVSFDSDPVILYDSEPMAPPSRRSIDAPDDDEDLALAKALSMSAVSLQPSGMTEEELLQKALEESRLQSHRVPTTDFDPYAPDAQKSATDDKHSEASTSRHTAAKWNESPHKMESDEGMKKPARSMKRRVFGGRKTMANKAGVV